MVGNHQNEGTSFRELWRRAHELAVKAMRIFEKRQRNRPTRLLTNPRQLILITFDRLPIFSRGTPSLVSSHRI